MIFKKEYRYVYGVWGYFEDILKELNADIKKEEKGDLREYRAEVDNVTIVGRIKYEKREIPILSRAFGKIPITRVEIEVNERGVDTPKSKKIYETIVKKLHLMTLRFGA